MKRILINATHTEELRVALVDGQTLYDLDIQRSLREPTKSNVYLGRIMHIAPALEAAFVNYGANRHGFLPLKEISPEYFKSALTPNERPNIKDLIQEGQEVMVQIEKEERGNKGAALTTFISLAGRFLVLMPNNPTAGGISRRVEGEDRNTIREALEGLEVPEGMGVIIRTAGVGRNTEELQWDLNMLVNLWNAIKTASKERSAPFLIHQEGDVVIRAIRDYLRQEIGQIVIDNKEVFEKAISYIQRGHPDLADRIELIELYDDKVPLFNRFQIENQIESAHERMIRLPSGGAIVIDHTEALVSIDINSARATKGSDIEETALNTNLEAAVEIARQLRLRDLSGLIVIDFIDMGTTRNQREVENKLREALRMDRARVQVGRISRFGLLEMSRQRLRSSLEESTHTRCPRCNGHGTIRSVESLALSIIRLIEEDAIKPKTTQIQAQVPVEVATYLMNEKRQALAQIEQRHKVGVLVIPNQYLETPHYKVERTRSDETPLTSNTPSYELAHKPEVTTSTQTPASAEMIEPAVKERELKVPTQPTRKSSPLKNLFAWLSGLFSKPEKVQPIQSRPAPRKRPPHQRSHSGSHHHTRQGSSSHTPRTERPRMTDRHISSRTSEKPASRVQEKLPVKTPDRIPESSPPKWVERVIEAEVMETKVETDTEMAITSTPDSVETSTTDSTPKRTGYRKHYRHRRRKFSKPRGENTEKHTPSSSENHE
jgi:ribonuclease E